MSNCVVCGAHNEDGTRSCRVCGSALGGEAKREQPRYVQAPRTGSPSGKKAVLIAAAASGVLVVGGVVAFLVASQRERAARHLEAQQRVTARTRAIAAELEARQRAARARIEVEAARLKAEAARLKAEEGRSAGQPVTSEQPPAEAVPVVRGSLDKAVIRRVIRRHINEVKYCYQKELAKKPNLAGKVVIQFTIAASGRVVASMVQRTTMDNARVEGCINKAVRRWVFPAPEGGGIVIVSYPFVLRTAG